MTTLPASRSSAQVKPDKIKHKTREKEADTKRRIKKVLDNHRTTGNIYYYMPVPYGYGQQTLDYIGFASGHGFAVEAKRPGAKPTARQELTIVDMRLSGAKVFVIDGTGNTDTVEDLDLWLRQQENRGVSP